MFIIATEKHVKTLGICCDLFYNPARGKLNKMFLLHLKNMRFFSVVGTVSLLILLLNLHPE